MVRRLGVGSAWSGFAWAFNSRTPWALKGYRCKGWSSPLTEGAEEDRKGTARVFSLDLTRIDAGNWFRNGGDKLMAWN